MRRQPLHSLRRRSVIIEAGERAVFDMGKKIGLISDVHATVAPLREALQVFTRADVGAVLCAGDVAGYGTELEETIRLLAVGGCRTVSGNHDLWQAERAGLGENTSHYLWNLPRVLELEVSEQTLYMVHASPPASLMAGIRLLDEDGVRIDEQFGRWSEQLKDFASDVLVVGHTHQVFAERLGATLVINPGSTLFNHSCALLSLPEMEVEFLALGGRAIRYSWNWGMAGRSD